MVTKKSIASRKPLAIKDLRAIYQQCQEASELVHAAAIAAAGSKVGLYVTTESGEVAELALFFGRKRAANARFAAKSNRTVRRLLAEVLRLRSLLTLHGIEPDLPPEQDVALEDVSTVIHCALVC
jgi:hypothetical protein